MANQVVVPLPPPNIVYDPAKVEAWYASLSPIQRGRYLQHLEDLIASMGPRRKKLFNLIKDRMQSGTPLPLEVNLGNWGAIVGGLTAAAMQVGTSIYLSKEQADNQKDLLRDQGALQTELAKIQAQAQLDAQQAMSNAQTDAARAAAAAQVEAARIAGGSSVEQAKIQAQRDVIIRQQRAEFWSQHGTAILASGAVVGVGVTAIILLRKRRKKRA